jgi:hypothetical protein
MQPVFGHLKAVPSRSLKQHPQSLCRKTTLRFVDLRWRVYFVSGWRVALVQMVSSNQDEGARGPLQKAKEKVAIE